MSSVKPRSELSVGPGDDDRWDARPVHRRHFRPGLVHRHLIRGMRPQHGDAGIIRSGFMVGRPVHRAALQEAEAHSPALHDHRRARCLQVAPRSGMRNAEFVQPRDRRQDGRIAVVHVVGDAHRGNAGVAQRRAAGGRIGEEALVVERVAAWRLVQAAFKVAEHQVGGLERVPHAGERYRRVTDVHQVHVSGQDQSRHYPITIALQAGPYRRAGRLPIRGAATKLLAAIARGPKCHSPPARSPAFA